MCGPAILGELGILTGKKAVVYPGFEEELVDAQLLEDKVVVFENIITARGMGVSVRMGLVLVSLLKVGKKLKNCWGITVF